MSGAHIQLRLFADRLEVQSPGGLFGTVSEENIEHEQSTRNYAVVRLLEDHGLVEQRGIGVNRMVQSMLEAGLERPIFRDSLTSFLVVLKNHTMMDDEAYRWLADLADQPLSDPQRIALVYAWRTGSLANRDYQGLNSVSSVRATRELRDLVHKGLLSLHGARGAAFYTLARLPARRRRGAEVIGSQEGAMIAHVRRYGRITNSEARRLLGVEDIMAMRQILRRMVRHGLLAQRGTSKQNTYYELGPAAGR
jgi:ATP-dependent DNA helicase RecG